MVLISMIAQLLTGDFVLPYAWLEHCATQPAARCEVAKVTLMDVARVNKVINEGIAPAKDQDERWTVFPADRRGDCDDYAVSKRAALMALGMPADAMRLELGEVYRNNKWTPHLVLVVKVEGHEWVLDNLERDSIYAPDDRPRPWRDFASQPFSNVMWDMKK